MWGIAGHPNDAPLPLVNVAKRAVPPLPADWRRLAYVASGRRFGYRPVKFGVETLEPGLVLPRHRHANGYATVVLAGSFEEAGFAGRFAAKPGDVLLHGKGHFSVPDPDTLARLAERDAEAAAAQLRTSLSA